jgi:hypothetical protein
VVIEVIEVIVVIEVIEAVIAVEAIMEEVAGIGCLGTGLYGIQMK